jgi:hypothetical protein
VDSVKEGGRFSGLRRRTLKLRIAELEADVEELRRHNLRLAELADIVQELLIPLASRDQARIDEAIARYSRGL